jgi:hypothetical protein
MHDINLPTGENPARAEWQPKLCDETMLVAGHANNPSVVMSGPYLGMGPAARNSSDHG